MLRNIIEKTFCGKFVKSYTIYYIQCFIRNRKRVRFTWVIHRRFANTLNTRSRTTSPKFHAFVFINSLQKLTIILHNIIQDFLLTNLLNFTAVSNKKNLVTSKNYSKINLSTYFKHIKSAHSENGNSLSATLNGTEKSQKIASQYIVQTLKTVEWRQQN